MNTAFSTGGYIKQCNGHSEGFAVACCEDKKSLEDERDSLSKDLSIKALGKMPANGFTPGGISESKVGAVSKMVVSKVEFQH